MPERSLKEKHCESDKIIKAGQRKAPDIGELKESGTFYSFEYWACTGGLFGIPGTSQTVSAKCIPRDVNEWHEALYSYVENRLKPAFYDAKELIAAEHGTITVQQKFELDQVSRWLEEWDNSKFSKEPTFLKENSWEAILSFPSYLSDLTREIVDTFKQATCEMDRIGEVEPKIIPSAPKYYSVDAPILGQDPPKKGSGSGLTVGSGAKIVGISAAVAAGLYFTYRIWEG